MNNHDRQIIHSSKCPNWRTPEDLFNALHEEFSFAIDLAADVESRKLEHYMGPDNPCFPDALAADWANWTSDWKSLPGFLNPPWSREAKMSIEPWVDKCVMESQRGWRGVSIFPASVQTKWWQLVRQHAYEIRLIPHRVSFELSEADLAAWNATRVAAGLDAKAKPDNAGGNTAVVVWKPLAGYVHPWEASVRYWTYRR